MVNKFEKKKEKKRIRIEQVTSKKMTEKLRSNPYTNHFWSMVE